MTFVQRIYETAERVGMGREKDAITGFDRSGKEPPKRLHVA